MWNISDILQFCVLMFALVQASVEQSPAADIRTNPYNLTVGPLKGETGRFFVQSNWANNEYNPKHCLFCGEKALSDTTYRHQQDLQCLEKNKNGTNFSDGLRTDFERENDLYALCNVGKVPVCNSSELPQAATNHFWYCDSGVSLVSYSVYFSCGLICNLTKTVQREFYCSENLQWEERLRNRKDCQEPAVVVPTNDDNTYLIIGIVVGVVLLLVTVIVVGKLVCYCRWRIKQLRKNQNGAGDIELPQLNGGDEDNEREPLNGGNIPQENDEQPVGISQDSIASDPELCDSGLANVPRQSLRDSTASDSTGGSRTQDLPNSDITDPVVPDPVPKVVVKSGFNGDYSMKTVPYEDGSFSIQSGHKVIFKANFGHNFVNSFEIRKTDYEINNNRLKQKGQLKWLRELDNFSYDDQGRYEYTIQLAMQPDPVKGYFRLSIAVRREPVGGESAYGAVKLPNKIVNKIIIPKNTNIKANRHQVSGKDIPVRAEVYEPHQSHQMEKRTFQSMIGSSLFSDNIKDSAVQSDESYSNRSANSGSVKQPTFEKVPLSIEGNTAARNPGPRVTEHIDSIQFSSSGYQTQTSSQKDSEIQAIRNNLANAESLHIGSLQRENLSHTIQSMRGNGEERLNTEEGLQAIQQDLASRSPPVRNHSEHERLLNKCNNSGMKSLESDFSRKAADSCLGARPKIRNNPKTNNYNNKPAKNLAKSTDGESRNPSFTGKHELESFKQNILSEPESDDENNLNLPLIQHVSVVDRRMEHNNTFANNTGNRPGNKPVGEHPNLSSTKFALENEDTSLSTKNRGQPAGMAASFRYQEPVYCDDDNDPKHNTDPKEIIEPLSERVCEGAISDHKPEKHQQVNESVKSSLSETGDSQTAPGLCAPSTVVMETNDSNKGKEVDTVQNPDHVSMQQIDDENASFYLNSTASGILQDNPNSPRNNHLQFGRALMQRNAINSDHVSSDKNLGQKCDDEEESFYINSGTLNGLELKNHCQVNDDSTQHGLNCNGWRANELRSSGGSSNELRYSGASGNELKYNGVFANGVRCSGAFANETNIRLDNEQDDMKERRCEVEKIELIEQIELDYSSMNSDEEDEL